MFAQFHGQCGQCVLYVKAGVASMAGALFIQWPVRGLYGPGERKTWTVALWAVVKGRWMGVTSGTASG